MATSGFAVAKPQACFKQMPSRRPPSATPLRQAPCSVLSSVASPQLRHSQCCIRGNHTIFRRLVSATQPLQAIFGLAFAGQAVKRQRRLRKSAGRNAAMNLKSLTQAAEISVGAAQACQLPQLSAEERHQLQQGGRVQKQERHGSEGSGYVVIDVRAPPSLVMQGLSAFEDYPDLIPVVRKAVLSHQKKCEGHSSAKCAYRISKFWFRIDVDHSVEQDARLVRFDLDPNGVRFVLQEASGYWFVEPSPDGPPGTSRVWLCVNRLKASPFLPQCIVDYAAERALRRATSWLKPAMEERWKLHGQLSDTGAADRVSHDFGVNLRLRTA
mmetsp:Transcript_77534/g.136783  ORF Transcript_77534/g.136783 Transcript_77534/m.136783 type:complete len:326 (-) Transcript_77534:97-1074(-)|eukprot:CAMPEP_0197625986 /NCGR_PEP_ID=MMETSP1338-20131121/5168_1 /TAXON_ID=43686 ORGANISM="Pelagodinium beii, Strain RCC1491" /NCGR_SAMPLE_ID=MMETSP1338 /ASSEMBLY_ACC=CAM_ASM_000754 /LENGTH=325 /DNA_ID=CAMNT_0043196501 /DNA_START=49 /DNA_END=1026 /DNA_ORIENTATION=+